MSWKERLRAWTTKARAEAAYYRRLAEHPQTPRLAKALLLAALLYATSPIDLIPDWIPLLGWVDDLLVVPVLLWLALRIVPEQVKAEARESVNAE